MFFVFCRFKQKMEYIFWKTLFINFVMGLRNCLTIFTLKAHLLVLFKQRSHRFTFMHEFCLNRRQVYFVFVSLHKKQQLFFVRQGLLLSGRTHPGSVEESVVFLSKSHIRYIISSSSYMHCVSPFFWSFQPLT